MRHDIGAEERARPADHRPRLRRSRARPSTLLCRQPVDRALRQPQAGDVLRRRRAAAGARRPDGADVLATRTARSPPCSRRCSCIAMFVNALAAPAPKLEQVQGSDAVRGLVAPSRLRRQGDDDDQLPADGRLAAAARPAAVRAGHARRLPLTEAAWTSSGQMVRRFEIARAIGSGGAGLFNTDDNKPGPNVGFPMLDVAVLLRHDRAGARARRRAPRSGARPRSRNGTRCCWRRPTGCSAESRRRMS